MYFSATTVASSGRIIVPRAWRFIFCGRRRKLWRLQAPLARILPVAVKRNRFLAADLFFSLGISATFRFLESLRHEHRRRRRPAGHARPPDRPAKRRAKRGVYARRLRLARRGRGRNGKSTNDTAHRQSRRPAFVAQACALVSWP